VTDERVTKDYFVDEAGDLTLFDKNGQVIGGNKEVPHCFSLVGLVDLGSDSANM
jgi:hypothetical protein